MPLWSKIWAIVIYIECKNNLGIRVIDAEKGYKKSPLERAFNLNYLWNLPRVIGASNNIKC
jgi:hypothetical protein